MMKSATIRQAAVPALDDPAPVAAPATGGAGSARQLSTFTLLAYAAMALGPAIFSLAINVMLPQLYAKELGLSLEAIGVTLLTIRVFDAFSDQVVGYLSDRTRTRIGARKPWMIAGTILTLVSCYYLFMPPAGCGITYFAAWRLAYDIGWTMTTVTFYAWGAELSVDYRDRSRITGYSGISTNMGVVIKNLAPIVLFWLGLTRSSSFSLEMFKALFWIFLPIIVVLTAVSVIFTPSGTAVARQGLDIPGLARSMRTNKPFWTFVIGFFVAAFGQGMLALLFTFYDSHLKIGPWYPYLMMGFGGVTVLSIPAWVRMANRIGKHRAYTVAMIMGSVSIQAFWFIDPRAHTQGTVALIGAVILFLVAFSSACSFVAPASMLADVVDYGTWRTGTARAGSYFAFYSLITKIAMAIGSGLGFTLLGRFHYDVTEGGGNGAFATFGLLFTVLLLPGILQIAGGMVIWHFPLTKRRHDILQRRIASRPAAEIGPRPLAREGTS
ncbi:MFS transporter [Nitrospirillum sp. BR 11828]|uniref:MFS transporter n=1 Tax=Nitrospirillum sp. BR 11828 TaxID=3104325 RepID=UPI002ACA947D|nr:MFS transporter [Nitrospirillum sp. BR 11828]MDZ5645869.1 MFS transporter [Nitrospirillum sp. BR 11828]